ncbi:probable salivary secreted peptide [Halyomorpha halys]|uniref:probable salivary secreted peptide n=1 Tax=Halyomorpha halys TaxID=286706 RepID=UPI0006D4EFF0|nr:probable salivary secreted peptide [Halyomorpha halys]
MNQVLVSLILATAGAILLVSVPSDGVYNPGYGWRNGTGNTSVWNNRGNRTVYGQHPYYNSSYPANRYPVNYYASRIPRSTPYWGNSSQNASHNFFWGHKNVYDRLLYFTRVKKSSSFMRKVVQDMEFPARYQRPNGTISYIEVLDQKPVGEGGYASILRGGVGYKNVTFHFKSERGKGFDFSVYVYGY